MKVATQRRLEDYAEAVGSKAKTISGMMRAVRAHGLPQKILPWLDRQARRKPARRDDDKAYGHCVAAAIAARRAGAKPHQRNDAMIGAMILAGVPESQYDLYYSYFRMRLGLNGNHELYPISGLKSRTAGDAAHGNRWVYHASTLRGLIGVDVVKKIASMGGLKRHRGAGGGIYIVQPYYARGGVSVHRCVTQLMRNGFICFTSDGYGYHVSTAGKVPGIADYRRAAREALQAQRNRIATTIKKQSILDNASKVFVTVEDSLKSGNCRPITELVRHRLATMLGAEGEIGAVRGDLVLAVRRADNYALRAVAVALERAGL